MKADKTSTLALVVAAILLLVVGAMSYRDYINDKLEKKWADRAAAKQGQAPAPASVPATNPPAVPAPQAQVQAAQTPQVAPNAAYANVAAPETNPAPPPVAPAPAAPNAGVPQNSLPQNLPATWEGNPQTPAPAAAPDPKLSQYQANLDAIRQENALLQQKLEEARRGSAPPQSPSAVESVSSQTPQVSPVRAPATGPASANPAAPASPQSADSLSPEEMQKELAAMADQVRKAPALAKVVEYDAEWAILTINGGKDRNIEEDMKFAVRRGSEILGWAKVKFVEDSQSVAELMSPNKYSKTARKPEPGDDIIAFNLF